MLAELIKQIQVAEANSDTILNEAKLEAKAIKAQAEAELLANNEAFILKQKNEFTDAIAKAKAKATASSILSSNNSVKEIEALLKSAKTNKQKAVDLVLTHLGV